MVTFGERICRKWGLLNTSANISFDIADFIHLNTGGLVEVRPVRQFFWNNEVNCAFSFADLADYRKVRALLFELRCTFFYSLTMDFDDPDYELVIRIPKGHAVRRYGWGGL